MYPKNAASPPFITVGQVVQISDGAVQTSGASARVKTGTGSWGAAAGTLACDTTSGIWTYTPTQGETDADVWAVAVYKSACVGCDKTVVTTISTTAGHAGVDWANVIGKTTTNALTGTTVADAQKVDLNTIKTQSITCGAGVTVGVYVGGTGAAALASDATAIKAVTDALGATAAARLQLSALQIIPGTVDTVVNSHTPTTTEFQADDITEATADHYNGRIIIFTSGALAGQATSISDYVAVGGIGQFSVVALTEAPTNNDSFVIL